LLENGLVLVVDFNDGLALIRTAVLANAVCKVILPAVFTLDEVLQRKRVVSAAAVTATLRDFAFR
jgi:hypothetical protein